MSTNSRSRATSRVLLTLGAVGVFLSGILGWLNAAVVNGETFAGLVNEVRQDEDVKTEIGQAVAAAAIDAQPDLIAVEPAIAAGAAAVVGSPILDGVFTPAIASFHEAMTKPNSDSAVLKLADLGATVTVALDRFVPRAGDVLPADLSVELATIGGQQGLAGQIIPVIGTVSTLAWVVPGITLALIAMGIWAAPGRRIALVNLGWRLVVVAGLLGLVVLGLNLAALLLDDSTLTGAVVGAGLAVFSEPLSVRFIAIAVIGGLIVASAGALLPQVDVTGQARAAVGLALRRPRSVGWALTRALIVIALGLLVILFPSVSTQAVAVVAGLVILLYGVTELDVIAERSRAADEASAAQRQPPPEPHAAGEPPRVFWLIPVAAALVGVLVLALLIVPDHLPQQRQVAGTAPVDPEACNGHVELCDRPFDEVVLAASHNSMSIADGTWFLAEQPKDMVESLDDGIRGLLVDTWYGQPTQSGQAVTAEQNLAEAEADLTATYGPDVVASIRRTIDLARTSPVVGPVEPYFCHTVCEIGSEPMAPVMRRLSTWLQQNPREVVVLFIQDVVTPADTDAVLREAGLTDVAYTHSTGSPWPTLRQMIDADQRLLVLMENTGGGAELPYLHQGFDLVQDTEYTFDSAQDFDCALKRGQADNPLFSVNHWLASFTRLVSSAEQVNTYEMLTDRVDQCRQERGRIPSMIAVNWYDRGDLFRVVDELNGVA